VATHRIGNVEGERLAIMVMARKQRPTELRTRRILDGLASMLEVERFDSAERGLARLLRIQLDPESNVRARLLQAECYFGLRQLARARELISSLDQEKLDPQPRLQTDLLYGHILAYSGQAREALDKVMPVLRRRDSVEEFKARAQGVAGLALYRMGHYRWAKELFKSSAAYYRLAGRRAKLAGTLINLGLVAKSQGRLDLALDYFDEAARLQTGSGHPVSKLRLYLNRGICLFKLGQVENARACFLDAKPLADSVRADPIASTIDMNLGHIYRSEGNYETAREFYTEALAIAEGLGVERSVCLSLEFLGEAYFEEGRPAEALLHLHRAHEIAKRIAPSGDLMMEVLRRRGEVHAALGDRSSALRDLRRAVQLCSSRGERREQVLAERGFAFVGAKTPEEQASRLQKVLAELDTLGDRFEYARTVYLVLEQGTLASEQHPWLAEASTTAMHYFNSLASRTWKNRLETILGHTRKVAKLVLEEGVYRDNRAKTHSVAFARTLDAARVAARGYDPVLILGETGVGKEVLAQLVHEWSPRAGEPLLAINCGTLPENLVESELFGHVRGAFTGADRDKPGLFEAARGGSVLLDEVADLPIHTQVKLLRFIDMGELRRVGDSQVRRVEVRVLAATNKNVRELIREGRFREDLFYRLNVFCIEVPPLRERREDILELAEAFLHETAQTSLQFQLSMDLRRWLETYDWPGNVRELRNVCHYLAAHAWGKPEIEVRDLPAQLRPVARADAASKNPFELERLEFERTQIARALRETKGNVQAAARMLRMSRNHVSIKMRKYGLKRESFRD
jgi:transcriptional regulator with PAS, ATPase and Fis domain/Tfp pilus assembly protein PilF